ncbi:MAG: type II toxin-antitoxin system HicA family toxin [Cytophagales bacterium]|nr:type II toxin-antitoxin system HicA family toxin [Cytophagales bacterium]
MSKKEKLVERFRSSPNDYSWAELESLLSYFGFAEIKKGKTAGSRRAFINASSKQIIRLHKPHLGSILKQYQIKEVREILGI